MLPFTRSLFGLLPVGLAVGMLGLVQVASAGGMLSVSREIELNASADTVWKMIGHFNHLDVWHPAVVDSSLQGTGVREGDIRVLTLGDGANITETLLSHSDGSRSYSYEINQGPLPVMDYVSSVTVSSMGEMTSRVVWESTFDEKGVSSQEAVDVITGVYDAGLDALKRHFNTR